MQTCLQAHSDSRRPLDPAAERQALQAALLSQKITDNTVNALSKILYTTLLEASGYLLQMCGAKPQYSPKCLPSARNSRELQLQNKAIKAALHTLKGTEQPKGRVMALTRRRHI
jgi:hypothetical protein